MSQYNIVRLTTVPVRNLQASYGEDKLYGNYTDFNPLFGTDYGICSCIKPQVAFNKSLTHVPYWNKVNSVRQRALQCNLADMIRLLSKRSELLAGKEGFTLLSDKIPRM